MAITTQAGANAGALQPYLIRKASGGGEGAGFLATNFYSGGEPPAAAAPTPGLAGAALTSYTGQIPFTNPTSGNTYLYGYDVSNSSPGASATGANFVADRLWHNSGIVVTTTTAQTINSVAWPARDLDASTDGRGVMVGLEWSVASTNPGAITNCTMSYTNSAGTAGRTATITSIPATTAANTFMMFELQVGDVGVRSIQSVTLGTSLVTGTVHLVAFRIIDMLCTRAAGIASQGSGAVVNGLTVRKRDMHAAGFVRMFDNTVPWLFSLSQATASQTGYGVFQVAQG